MTEINKPEELSWGSLPRFISNGNHEIEPKFDGVRCQLSKDDLVKDGRIKSIQFPEVMQDAIKLPDDTILDGELCVKTGMYTASFWHMLQRNTVKDSLKIKLLASKMPVTFMAFDILKYKGEDMISKPYHERRQILREAIDLPKMRNIDIVCQMPTSISNIQQLIKQYPGTATAKKAEELMNKYR